MRTVYVEVSNTLALGFTTGIQRVTKETLRAVQKISSSYRFIPILYCPWCATWRHLTDTENLALFSQTGYRKNCNEAISGWYHLARKMAPFLKQLPGVYRLLQQYKKIRHPPCDPALFIQDFEQGAIFLDMESSWFSPMGRDELLGSLQRKKVWVAVIHYDIIPFLFPEYVHPETAKRFALHFDAHIRHNSTFFCISDNTLSDLQRYVAAHYLARPLRSDRITLGANYRQTNDSSNPSLPRLVAGKRYILSVGTVEPRKNYDCLLTAFEMVAEKTENLFLVIVGKKGWRSENFFTRLERHPLYDTKIFWFSNIDDQQLTTLYQNAYLGIVPSLYEGYGLPVVEMLLHGCVTLSSDRGSLPEVGSNFVEYFNPERPGEISRLILRYCRDTALHRARKKRLEQYTAPTWEETAHELVGLLDTHFGSSQPNPAKRSEQGDATRIYQ